MVFEGKYINSELAANKPLADFIKHESHIGLSVEQLTEFWNLSRLKHGYSKEPEKQVKVGGRRSSNKANT